MDRYNRGNRPGQHSRGGRHSSAKPTSIAVQDPFLNTVRREQVAVKLALTDGEEREVLIDSFDQNTLLVYSPKDRDLEPEERALELIYKQAVRSVQPLEKVVRTYSGIALIDSEQPYDNEMDDD